MKLTRICIIVILLSFAGFSFTNNGNINKYPKSIIKTTIYNIKDIKVLLKISLKTMKRINNKIIKIRNLAIKSANGIYTQDDRKLLNDDLKRIIDDIEILADYTEFNNINLFNSSKKNWTRYIKAKVNPLVKAYKIPNCALDIQIDFLKISKNKKDISIESEELANDAITMIDKVIPKINFNIAKIASWLNRLDFVLLIQKSILNNNKNKITEITKSIEKRIFNLALQSANGVYNSIDRKCLNYEFRLLIDELEIINRCYNIESSLIDEIEFDDDIYSSKVQIIYVKIYIIILLNNFFLILKILYCLNLTYLLIFCRLFRVK